MLSKVKYTSICIAHNVRYTFNAIVRSLVIWDHTVLPCYSVGRMRISAYKSLMYVSMYVCMYVCMSFINTYQTYMLYMCLKINAPNMKGYSSEAVIDFDDIWQKYSIVSRIEFACFSFHVGLLFYQLFVFQTGHRK